MVQIFSGTKENKLYDNIVNKSSKVKLLVVETSTKNVKSVCCEQSNNINFRLFNYFAKIKMKDYVKGIIDTLFCRVA